MAQMDAFSAQIVKFVREMPDEALLELVKQKLGVLGGPAGRHAGRGSVRLVPVSVAKRPRPAPRSKAGASRPRHGAPASADRQGLLDSVERIVKAGSGVSASDVARLASIPQTRAAAALKELKLTKRIFQGGDRRFARYAADAKMAEQASSAARKTAKGPILPARKNIGRPRKRNQPLASAPAA